MGVGSNSRVAHFFGMKIVNNALFLRKVYFARRIILIGNDTEELSGRKIMLSKFGMEDIILRHINYNYFGA
jgi:hypothetical protein